MGNEKFNDAIRMASIEYMITHIGKIAYLAAGATPESTRLLHARVRDELEEVTPGDRDPALSDHTAAEFALAVDRFLIEIEADLLRDV
jgi:hypothetical protein